MFYLSNRKLKLFIITLLLLIFCFFLGMFKPKAATYTEYINYPSNNRHFEINNHTSSTSTGIFNSSGNSWEPFVNAGDGTLVFSLYFECTSQPCDPITQVQVISNNSFACEYSQSTWYRDNTTQYIIITPTCNVSFNNNHGLSNIYLKRNGGSGNVYGKVGEIATFVTKDPLNVSVSQTDVTNAISTATSQIVNQIIQQSTSVSNIQSDTNDIKNSITDSNIDSNNTSSSASTWNSKNASNGTITQLLTLPITLLQAIVNGLQTSCSSFSLGTLFGTTLSLPCINLSNLLGSTLFNVIDALISGLMIYAIVKKLIKIFNDFTNLRTNQVDELYGGGN